ncbi:MAG TPA: response regulator transcription factor [Actinomycetota bacterium]|nr:response regulator transcription factor [Actinomycetota bacterium]
MDKALTVMIADDAEDMRLLLRMRLMSDPRFEVIGEASTGDELSLMVDSERPDVALLDLSMPSMDLDHISEMKSNSPETRVIVLSGYESALKADLVREAGADAYVEKGTDMMARISTVISGLFEEAEAAPS